MVQKVNQEESDKWRPLVAKPQLLLFLGRECSKSEFSVILLGIIAIEACSDVKRRFESHIFR